ncbi:endoplasmic oxidoreductin-1 [Coprinopsis cinerea okayama7|uniref:Endoplasmic oxidoreductin-1 n=1 Tax=Coprinopsis cinerea (strain Okayama-7 / 130 / ATCC MYA-4618 / FGSC 9003) TaxID=240176 RepID=A8N5F8_COPC7|nr:endoplasmic oxidoreductin-1 [Coprinopsis cinerea okayama7\|eukprot:XP_001830103.2 endoplasmic oxidoreductin-1 [Coprinopsis cinerea okayama7\
MKPSMCRAFQFAFVLHLFGWSATSVYGKDTFLAETLLRKGQVQSVLEHEPAKSKCEKPVLTGPIETTLCDYETIESLNDELFSNLSDLVKTPFFRYFRADLYRECPFWDDYGSCSNAGCQITTVDESEIPEKWRAKALSEVDPSSRDIKHQLPGCYYRESDFCFLDDHTEGDYYDLQLVPERYTGYSGQDARRVWRAIYEENCFGLSELNLMTGKSPAPVSLPDTMIEPLHMDGQESDGHCLEKRVYYKVISGLHTSISIHICHEWLNQTTGEWGPNLQCFIDRVASHPERLKYIYFDTILMLRAVSRLAPYLESYDYCSTGSQIDDASTHEYLGKITDIAKVAGKFDEGVLFRGENANILKEEFKTHFRNVTRIMDCVGCDKCRLWGKIQTMGVATALKVLFELDETALSPQSHVLQRTEIVALMNTLFRFSESLKAVDDFRKMWKELDADETQSLASKAESTATALVRDEL